MLDGKINLECEKVKVIMDGIYIIVTYYINFRRYDNIYLIIYTHIIKIYRFMALFARIDYGKQVIRQIYVIIKCQLYVRRY